MSPTADSWYTDDNLVARERLKHDSDVVDALDRAWGLICQHLEQIDHEDYIVMSRKIYLAIKADSCEGNAASEAGYSSNSSGTGAATRHSRRAHTLRARLETAPG